MNVKFRRKKFVCGPHVFQTHSEDRFWMMSQKTNYRHSTFILTVNYSCTPAILWCIGSDWSAAASNRQLISNNGAWPSWILTGSSLLLGTEIRALGVWKMMNQNNGSVVHRQTNAGKNVTSLAEAMKCSILAYIGHHKCWYRWMHWLYCDQFWLCFHCGAFKGFQKALESVIR